MSTDRVLSAAERAARASILDGMLRRSRDGVSIPSGAFQDVLQEVGLRLGDPAVDRCLASLDLDPHTGLVSGFCNMSLAARQ